MRIRIVVAAMALLVLPGLVRAEEAPADVLRGMWGAMATGDFAAVEACWFPVTDAAFVAGQRAALAESSRMLQAGEIRVDVVDSRIQGDWAMVVVRFTVTRDGESDEHVQNEILAKHEGKWKYVFKPQVGAGPLAAYSESDLTTLEQWWWSNRDSFRE